MTRKKRLVAFAAIAVVSGGVLAGGVIAGQLGGLADPEEFDSAIRNDPVVKVGEIEAAGGRPAHGVYAQLTSNGLLCLWDAPSARAMARQGGCNRADDPLGGRKLMVSFAYDGGPAVADVQDARLIGLVSPAVAAVKVVMSDGTDRKMSLRRASFEGSQYLAFGYRVRQGDLRRSVTPKTVLALDEAGKEIDRQATGFAG